MKNVAMTQAGSILTIKVDLSKEFGRSVSGKTTVIATTSGNQDVPGHEAEGMKIGLNIYKKPEK